MKEFKMEFPQSEKEFDSMTNEQKDNLIEAIVKYKEKVNNFLQLLAEEAVYPIIKENKNIEDLVLDPNYRYDDEGYSPNCVMPFVNGESDDYYRKYDMEALDLACSKFAHLMTSDIAIDVPLVRARYDAKNLEDKLEKKYSSKKSPKI